MKKFDFRLNGALKVREMQLEVERTQLQKLFTEKQRLEGALKTLAESRVQAATFIRQAPDIVNTDLRALSAFLIGTQHRMTIVQESIVEMNGKIGEQKSKVVDAKRKVRLLEKVRDKKAEEWRAEANREIETTAQEVWSSAHFAAKLHRRTE